MTILRLTEGLREKDSQIKILRNDLKKSEELRLNYALTINTMANYSLSAELKKYFGTIMSVADEFCQVKSEQIPSMIQS